MEGTGWDRPFEEYLALVRAGGDVARSTGMPVVPSVKYHLPRLDEPFHEAEYRHTTRRLAEACGEPPLRVEIDFSPTLAGDALAEDRAQVVRWLREVPERVRAAAAGPVAAYGGWDLSDRNLRVLDARADRLTARPPDRRLTGTGNVATGRMILAYALRGCESVQLHTFFQLPLSEYPAEHGSRTQRALHALVFDPAHGLIAGMLELEHAGRLERRGGTLHFLDLPRRAD